MISVIKGDITTLQVDAIVNAANSSLLGGGGVDGAIHRAAGPSLLEACKKVRQERGECPAGEAVITHAGKLQAKFVIHTVGPIWRGGNKGEARLLESAYRNSLTLAAENRCETVAFPTISTGAYGYPKRAAADIAVTTIGGYLLAGVQMQVLFCCFDEENYEIMQMRVKEYFETI
jgi:O-acetyl-ADP-ribose deacetylase (regulator of RNase III)